MHTLPKEKLEEYVNRIEKAAVGFRNSLSPSLVQDWNKNIQKIPVIEERLNDIQKHTDKIDNAITDVALNKQRITRIEGTLDYAVKSIWGLVITAAASLITAIIKFL